MTYLFLTYLSSLFLMFAIASTSKAQKLIRGRPYMTSDGRGEGGSAKSDFISKVLLIKHMMRGEGGQKRAKII